MTGKKTAFAIGLLLLAPTAHAAITKQTIPIMAICEPDMEIETEIISRGYDVRGAGRIGADDVMFLDVSQNTRSWMVILMQRDRTCVLLEGRDYKLPGG